MDAFLSCTSAPKERAHTNPGPKQSNIPTRLLIEMTWIKIGLGGWHREVLFQVDFEMITSTRTPTEMEAMVNDQIAQK
jgi:hypothetical protein